MIIGVTGLTENPDGQRGSAGAGKDAVADWLQKKHGYVKLALADEIKRITACLWDWDPQTLWGPSELRSIPDKRYPIAFKSVGPILAGEQNEYLTPRHALQQIGTEVARAIDPDVWVRHAIRMHDRLQKGSCYYDQKSGLRYCTEVEGVATSKKNVVIPDVRFPNEIRKRK